MRIRTVVTGIVVLVWLGAVWGLHKRSADQSFLEQGARVDVVSEEFVLREDYLGVYLNNQKIGYSSFLLKEAGEQTQSAAGDRVYLYTSESRLRVDAMGIPFDVRMKSHGSVNADLELMDFSFAFESSGQTIQSVGTIEDNTLRVTTKSEGSEDIHEYPLKGPLFAPDIIHLVVARRGLEVGKQWSLAVYDPLTTSIGEIEVRVEGLETIDWEGEETAAYHLTLSFKGFTEDAWVDEAGDVFKERSSFGGISFVCRRETRQEAMGGLDSEAAPLDLISASLIPSDVEIPYPEDVVEMRVEVSGCQPSDLYLDEITQTLVEKDPIGTFEVLIQKRDYAALLAEKNTPGIRYSGSEDMAEFLESEPLVQSNHERIREQAQNIVGNADSRWQAVLRISGWLHENIDKEIRVTIPSALEVLNSMSGDCNEHSTLFAGLSRSLGIPTKICAGVVYQEKAFYYHAWNEVLIGDEDPVWLPVDSTLGRPRMDAAHLKLNEGSLDKQVELAKLIGNMDLRILSWRDDSGNTFERDSAEEQ